MKVEFLKIFHGLTPATDKIMAVIGSAAAVWLTHINTILGIIIGVLTIGMLIPRVIMAWRALRKGDRFDDDKGA